MSFGNSSYEMVLRIMEWWLVIFDLWYLVFVNVNEVYGYFLICVEGNEWDMIIEVEGWWIIFDY